MHVKINKVGLISGKAGEIFIPVEKFIFEKVEKKGKSYTKVSCIDSDVAYIAKETPEEILSQVQKVCVCPPKKTTKAKSTKAKATKKTTKKKK